MRERWTRATPALALGVDEARALLRPALGDVAVVGLAPLSGGLSNTNIRVALRDDDAVVLRLYQRDPGQMRKEAALARLVAGRVPAPRYLQCGTRDDGQAYAVVEWIDGLSLQEVARGADDAMLGAMGLEIGRVLAAIHSFTFAQAGFLDGDLTVQPFPGGGSAAAFLEATLGGVAGERLGRELADAAVVFAKANEHRLAAWSTPPRLTHFDFGASNILMGADGAVAAVLDWEFAASASPAADFGNLLRPPFGQSTAFVEAVAQGYRDGGGALPEDWRALTRLADIGAWAEFLSRPMADGKLIEDARAMIALAMARG